MSESPRPREDMREESPVDERREPRSVHDSPVDDHRDRSRSGSRSGSRDVDRRGRSPQDRRDDD